MGRLQDRLNRMSAASKEQLPDDVVATMGAATGSLRASGILERIPTVGGTLPGFELPDTDGKAVDSAALLAQGPLVVTFYRGHW